MMRDLNCSEFQASIGLSVYALGFGITPLVTASLSEEFGRRPLYIGSGIGYLLMFIQIALYAQLHTIITMVMVLTFHPGQKIFRLLLLDASCKVHSGLREQLWLEGQSLIYGHLRSMFFIFVFLYLSCSTFWHFFYRRGVPMSLFSLLAIGGTGLGPVYSGWIEMNPRLEWRWIQWIAMMQVITSSVAKTDTNNFRSNLVSMAYISS